MSRNYYSEIHLHVTWHTKASAPLLVAKIETEVHHYLKGRCINTPGVFIHEIGGIEDHVHLCLTVPPTLLISDFIGQLKGASSHEINQKLGDGTGKILEWQAGYGVVSFGTGNLPWVKEYVRNQRAHHSAAKRSSDWNASPNGMAKADTARSPVNGAAKIRLRAMPTRRQRRA
jgi:putative transposase